VTIEFVSMSEVVQRRLTVVAEAGGGACGARRRWGHRPLTAQWINGGGGGGPPIKLGFRGLGGGGEGDPVSFFGI
jgi:hypothetical protein